MSFKRGKTDAVELPRSKRRRRRRHAIPEADERARARWRWATAAAAAVVVVTMNLNNSFIAGAGAYVKGKYAITPTGVVMKGTGRAFSVEPDELEWGGPVIGRGASGCVMCSRHRPTGTPLALKSINMYDKAKRDQTMREINALFDSNVRLLFHACMLLPTQIFSHTPAK